MRLCFALKSNSIDTIFRESQEAWFILLSVASSHFQSPLITGGMHFYEVRAVNEIFSMVIIISSCSSVKQVHYEDNLP